MLNFIFSSVFRMACHKIGKWSEVTTAGVLFAQVSQLNLELTGRNKLWHISNAGEYSVSFVVTANGDSLSYKNISYAYPCLLMEMDVRIFVYKYVYIHTATTASRPELRSWQCWCIKKFCLLQERTTCYISES